MQVELSAGANPRFDRDRRSYEASMKPTDHRDGLLPPIVHHEEVGY